MNCAPPVEPVAVVTMKLESVASSASVNAMFRPLVVVIVLPASYAAWSEIELSAQVTTLLLPSTQRIVPAAVVNPETFKNESASVVILTPFVPEGLNVD